MKKKEKEPKIRLTRNFVREWTEEYCAKGVYYEYILKRLVEGEPIDIYEVLNRDAKVEVKKIAAEERVRAKGGEKDVEG